jgi:hypothetical protein
MSTKDAINEYGNLILVIGGVVSAIGGILIWIATMVLTSMIDSRIEAQVGTTASVAGLTTTVALNTDAINDLGDDVDDLDGNIQGLNDDVKQTLRILASQ